MILNRITDGAQQLANRLRKVERHLRSWRRREGVSCWRAYDADLPEYAAAIDIYGEWLHVQEYRAPAAIPEETAQRRLAEIVATAGEVFAIPAERIAVKQRRRQTRTDRYGRMASRGQSLIVNESDLRFEVNLFDYLDTGLFLDHRPTRARVRQLAEGRDVLNLFAYTGSITVYAAAGGARSTTSVDLSNTYLQWARRNLALNGLDDPRHVLVSADVLGFLARDTRRYDVIFVDPPTFSNSKRAADFDVQRDHPKLLDRCVRRLAPDGVIVFSTNLRRFRLDRSTVAGVAFTDISAGSIPPDFARNRRIHHCFEGRATRTMRP